MTGYRAVVAGLFVAALVMLAQYACTLPLNPFAPLAQALGR